MKILFKLTSRSRPHQLFETIENIISHVSKECDYGIHCTLDSDDTAMRSAQLLKIDGVSYCFDISKNKVHAINRDMDMLDGWDILVNVSDDQKFIVRDFDRDIIAAFDNLDQFVHFPDGNRKDLATMSIIGRDYYLRDGYIYNPEYITECCDDEAQEVAKLRGCYKFVDKTIFNHNHPAYGKGQWDGNYAINMAADKQLQDRQTLQKRREAGFVS